MMSSLLHNMSKNCETAMPPDHVKITSFSTSRNFQIHRVRQYISGKFYFELWQSDELLRAAISYDPPHLVIDFHRKPDV